MARTKRAGTKSRERRAEAGLDRKAELAAERDDDERAARREPVETVGPDDVGGDGGAEASAGVPPIAGAPTTGPTLKRSGFPDIEIGGIVDATADQAIAALFSRETRLNLDGLGPESREEIGGTLAALGNAVARFAPGLVSIELRGAEDGGFQSRLVVAGDEIESRRHASIPSAIVASVVRLALYAVTRRTGKQVGYELGRWQREMMEGTMHLDEIALIATKVAVAVESGEIPTIDEGQPPQA